MLYHPIFSDTAVEYIKALDEHKDDEVFVRVNNPGGSVFAGWGMFDATASHKNLKIQVDGQAASMGFYNLLAIPKERVTALNVSRFLIHRANGWVETEEEQKLLDGINADIRAAMDERIDTEKFENVTGVTMDELFDPEKRKEVWITAKTAKEIGLIGAIKRLTDREQTAMSRMVASSKFAAELGFVEADTQPTATDIINEFTQKL